VSKRTLILIFLMAGSLLSAVSVQAQDGGPLTIVTPNKRYVSATQGPGEAQSIGSYALRLYGNKVAGDPTQDFVAGVVRPRDGYLLRLDWQDVTGDGPGQVIVVTQSAGSGGYLSADAFQLGETNIALVASVSNLAPNADLVAALKKAAGERH
jgi:outer membrane receptor protein involved in Fe transport